MLCDNHLVVSNQKNVHHKLAHNMSIISQLKLKKCGLFCIH